MLDRRFRREGSKEIIENPRQSKNNSFSFIWLPSGKTEPIRQEKSQRNRALQQILRSNTAAGIVPTSATCRVQLEFFLNRILSSSEQQFQHVLSRNLFLRRENDRALLLEALHILVYNSELLQAV